MQKRRNVAILFTAYNDGQTLPKCIDLVRQAVPDQADIWIVNDGSTDNTSEIADNKKCKLIEFLTNKGVGVAYRAGFQAIIENGGYDFVIKIDADGQHEPDFLPRMINYLQGGADMVVCSRFHPNSRQLGTLLDRVVLNNLFARELTHVTGWNITDARSGFFGIPIGILAEITPLLLTKGYGIPMEVTLRVWQQDHFFNRLEIPHPALYQGHNNKRRTEQYIHENGKEKLKRFQEAFSALISVYQDMGIDADMLSKGLQPGLCLDQK